MGISKSKKACGCRCPAPVILRNQGTLSKGLIRFFHPRTIRSDFDGYLRISCPLNLNPFILFQPSCYLPLPLNISFQPSAPPDPILSFKIPIFPEPAAHQYILMIYGNPNPNISYYFTTETQKTQKKTYLLSNRGLRIRK